MRGDRHGALAGRALGVLLEPARCLEELDVVLAHGDSVTLEVDVGHAQRAELAAAQAAPRRQRDGRTEPRRRCIDERRDLGRGGDPPLGCALGAGAGDLAGVAHDRPVLDRDVEHGPEEAVGLADRRPAPGPAQRLRVPGTDHRRGDGDDREVEQLVEVEPHVAAAGLRPAFADAGVLLEVALAVRTQCPAPQASVGQPVPSLDLLLDAVEVAGGVGGRPVGLGSGLPLPIRCREARLVPPGGKLPDRPEPAPDHHRGHRGCSSIGSTVPAAMYAESSDSGIRTWRPTRTNLMRRSAIRRRGNRTVVPRISAAASTVRSRSTVPLS